MMILRMGWRNLIRNGRRTLLTASIIAIGLACLILVDAVIQGMNRSMVATATDTFLGQAQVHAEGFRSETKVEQTLKDLPKVESLLRQDPSVSAFTERVVSTAMAGSASDAESVMLYGIDPVGEKKLSAIEAAVEKGSPLSDSAGSGILLGSRLARRLQAGLGDRIVVTCAKARSGELSQVMFRVAGIFSFGSADMDRGTAFVGINEARKMLGLDNEAHEIAFRFKSGDGSEAVHNALYESLSEGGNEALDWGRLMPDLKSALVMNGYSSALLAGLLAALLGLAILNTLFMVLYERLFEFGILRALGTRPARLALLVLSESAWLGLVGAALGLALGLAAIGVLSKVGINFSGIEYAGVTFQHALYPEFHPPQYTVFPLGVWLFTVATAVYPALHAARIVPAKALHRSLG